MLNEIILNYLPQDQFLNSFAIFGILILISIIAFYITEKIIFNLLVKMFRKTSTDIDDILVNRNVFSRLAYMVPALIFYNFSYSITQLSIFIQKASLSLIAMSGLMVISSFLNALSDMYEKTKYSERIQVQSK